MAADAAFPVRHPACIPLEMATITMMRGPAGRARIATDEEIDQHLANVGAGRLDLTQPPMISAWGCRPSDVTGRQAARDRHNILVE